VSRIDLEEGELRVDFVGRPIISYGFGELDELVLAYATTVHKSQGSDNSVIAAPPYVNPQILVEWGMTLRISFK
jgi:exodeoxyribonuclease V alpha subunit